LATPSPASDLRLRHPLVAALALADIHLCQARGAKKSEALAPSNLARHGGGPLPPPSTTFVPFQNAQTGKSCSGPGLD